MKLVLAFPLLTILFAGSVYSAESGEVADSGPKNGQVISDMGPYYEIPGGYNLQPGIRYRAVMDVADGPADTTALNRGIESAARFLNMHAASGIAASDMELAVVLHGQAAKAALNNAAYRERYQSDNPNDALLQALAEAGVNIYLCGQSASYGGIGVEELHANITMALSAMTVLTRLQVEGWALLP